MKPTANTSAAVIYGNSGLINAKVDYTRTNKLLEYIINFPQPSNA